MTLRWLFMSWTFKSRCQIWTSCQNPNTGILLDESPSPAEAEDLNSLQKLNFTTGSFKESLQSTQDAKATQLHNVWQTFHVTFCLQGWRLLILFRNSILQLVALQSHCKAHKMQRPLRCTMCCKVFSLHLLIKSYELEFRCKRSFYTEITLL